MLESMPGVVNAAKATDWARIAATAMVIIVGYCSYLNTLINYYKT